MLHGTTYDLMYPNILRSAMDPLCSCKMTSASMSGPRDIENRLYKVVDIRRIQPPTFVVSYTRLKTTKFAFGVCFMRKV